MVFRSNERRSEKDMGWINSTEVGFFSSHLFNSNERSRLLGGKKYIANTYTFEPSGKNHLINVSTYSSAFDLACKQTLTLGSHGAIVALSCMSNFW